MQERRRAELEAKRARLAEYKRAREERQKASAESAARRRESEVSSRKAEKRMETYIFIGCWSIQRETRCRGYP